MPLHSYQKHGTVLGIEHAHVDNGQVQKQNSNNIRKDKMPQRKNKPTAFLQRKFLTEREMGEAHQLRCAVQLRDKPIGELSITGLEASDLPAFIKEVEQDVWFSNHRHTGKPKLKCFFRSNGRKKYTYGFYIYPWALEAFDFIHSVPKLQTGPQREWLRGLLYGYSPGAIQAWLNMVKKEDEAAGRQSSASPSRPRRQARGKQGDTGSGTDRLPGIRDTLQKKGGIITTAQTRIPER